MVPFILMLLAANIQPKYYTNTNYIYDITGLDSMIYCATNGGFVRYNRLTSDFAVLTNTEGLQQNQQNAVSVDSSGHIWAGNDQGLVLINSDLTGLHIYPVECLTCTRVTEITCRKDSIYVGSTNGLLFINTKGTPTDFNDDTQVKIFEMPCNSVRSIAVDDTSIWIGTATCGIVHFSKDFLNMQNYTTAHGLLDNEINKIQFIGSQLYVATNAGLNRFVNDHFDTSLTNYQITDITSLGDSIILALNRSQQVGIFYGGSVAIIQNGLPWYTRVLCLLNISGQLYCGLGNRSTMNYYGEGIGLYEPLFNSWIIKKNRCAPSNHICDITANEHGVFVACGNRSAESAGAGWFNNQSQWVNFSVDAVLPSNDVHRCETAPDDRVWFGYNAFPNNSSSVMLSALDPEDSTWQHLNNQYNGMEGCEAVWDIRFDRSSNMYLSLARPTDKLWLIDSALNTVYYLDPQVEEFDVEIALDSAGKIWRTHTDAGLSMTDTRNTLFDRTDDLYHNFTTADGLISNYLRGCVIDRTSTLYVAADLGLVIYDGTSFVNRTDISASELLDLEIDSQGRIWILARDGIYALDPVNNTVEPWRFIDHSININFLESIGEMIQVQGFTFDPVRHCFWVGGETGLLRLNVQYDSVSEIGAANIYPNPVTQNIVRIKDIPQDSRVDIYTLSGRRIVQDLVFDLVFGEVIWEIPDDIPSGVYFALVKSERGNKTYKFAIVR